ncbi:MAG TPA: hypothetical protein VGM90_41060 [Kofleriaceae bacterium]
MKWLLHRQLRKFEKDTGYDAAYMHDVLDTDLGAFMKFARATMIGKYRKDLPTEVYAAVMFTGVVAADCGPCAQLGVTLALREGLPASTLTRILRGNLDDMEEPARIGVKFARAVIARDGAVADEMRAIIEARYGHRAVIAAGLALCAANLYPTFKWAIGYGHACSRIQVNDVLITPVHAHEIAA